MLHYGTGGGAELETVELTEHADRVEAGIVERVPHGLRRPIPFTDAEQRYLDARDALQSERIDAYLRRHRDESGGTEIGGRFPGEPVLVVRVTRRVAFHRRNLAPLVDGRLRVLRSRHTLDGLRAVEDEVDEVYEDSDGFVDEMLILSVRAGTRPECVDAL